MVPLLAIFNFCVYTNHKDLVNNFLLFFFCQIFSVLVSLIPFYFPINNILSDGGGKDCGTKAGCQGESEQTKELSFFVFSQIMVVKKWVLVMKT